MNIRTQLGLLVSGGALLTVALSPGAAAGQTATADPVRVDRTRVNEVQVIGTHNSYHRELSGEQQASFDALTGAPGGYAASLGYSHAGIGDQLAFQDVRGLELDLFPDPVGGLYGAPLLRVAAGLGPLDDPAWFEPGIKVQHIADLDYRTTCVQLTACLEQVETWSDANPSHTPVMIMLELKQSDPVVVAASGVQSPPWDAAALDALDAEIRSVVDEEDLLSPDDVRRPGLTLEESVLQEGWPTLAAARGEVMFLLDNEGELNDVYAEGRPSLEGRAVFTNSTPGEPDAAFLKRNEPRAEQTSIIADLVRQGYLVRTRSDVPLTTVLAEDTEMRDAALASGAQLVSTDFPEVGMSARYDRGYVARLPGGGPVRCNPVNASPGCRLDRTGG